MKRKFLFILAGVLLISMLFIGVASAKGNWIKGWVIPGPFETYPVWFHTSQKGNIVHLRDICAPDWSSCPRTTTVYNTDRFAEAPMCEYDDGSTAPAFLWNRQIYFTDMDGNVHADFPSAWVCWDYSEPWPVP